MENTEEGERAYAQWVHRYLMGEQPPLPHDHIYLRLLRGELTNLDQHDHADEASEETALQLSNWRKTVASHRQQFQARFPIEEYPWAFPTTDIESSHEKLDSYCNRCSKLIDNLSITFFCGRCGESGYGFDMCEACALQGRKCDGADHELRLVSRVVSRFGQGIRIFANGAHSMPGNPIPRWLPFVESLNLGEASLVAVVAAYAQRHGIGHPIIFAKTMPVELPGDSENVTRKLPGTVMLFGWRFLCVLLAHGEQCETRIQDYMTREHMSVFKLLLEWWNGDIQNVRLSRTAANDFLLRSVLGASELGNAATLSGEGRSAYHNHLAKLFELEFSPRDPKEEGKIEALRSIRALAARSASVQRLGYACFRKSLAPAWHEPDQHLSTKVNTYLKWMDEAVYPALALCRDFNAQETDRFALELRLGSEASLHLAAKNLRSIETLLGPKNLSATVVPCP